MSICIIGITKQSNPSCNFRFLSNKLTNKNNKPENKCNTVQIYCRPLVWFFVNLVDFPVKGYPRIMSSVTINDVARFAGVSKKTVSRVINNEINVSVETRDKVMAVINQLGFKRNPLGMALAKNRSLFIALLADNPSPGYLQKLQN